MAKNAKDYAKQQLGDLNLSHLDNERNVAQNTYNTSKSSLENNFNNLLQQISSNREDTRKNFNTGRATVAEQSYNANKTNQADLASRGVGNSGLKGLGEVGNRIETGRQYSNLANQFYSDMSELDTTEEQGRNQYNIDQQSLKNTLDQTLAGIDSRGADAQNSYNMSLGQLAETVQGRWDSNANAEAALNQAKAAAAQAHKDAVNAARQNLEGLKRQALTNIVNSDVSEDSKIAQIQTTFGVDGKTAKNILTQLGISNNISSGVDNVIKGATNNIITAKDGTVSVVPNTYDANIDYINQMIGGVK